MKIKNITISDIRSGKNWRVSNLDTFHELDFPMEDLEIEPFNEYGLSDMVVYSGIRVFLKDLGEPGPTKHEHECQFPPNDPKDLVPGMVPIIIPLIMLKEVQETGWDYCEYVDGYWHQVGLNPNPNAPLSEEYFADPVFEDPAFTPCGDEGPIRLLHKKGFQNWIKYLKD